MITYTKRIEIFKCALRMFLFSLLLTKGTNSHKKPLDGLQTPSQASDHTEIQKMQKHFLRVLEITRAALFCNASSKRCCPNHEALHEKLHNFLSWENCSPPSSLQACNCTPININLGYQLVSWYPLLGDYSPRLCKQTIK